MEEEEKEVREKGKRRREGRGGEGEMELESPTRNSTLCKRQTTSGISCPRGNTIGPRCSVPGTRVWPER